MVPILVRMTSFVWMMTIKEYKIFSVNKKPQKLFCGFFYFPGRPKGTQQVLDPTPDI